MSQITQFLEGQAWQTLEFVDTMFLGKKPTDGQVVVHFSVVPDVYKYFVGSEGGSVVHMLSDLMIKGKERRRRVEVKNILVEVCYFGSKEVFLMAASILVSCDTVRSI